jgi:hypothetical protein
VTSRDAFIPLIVTSLTVCLGASTARADFTCATMVARKGESAVGEGAFVRFAGISLNDDGLVAFTADRVKAGGPGVFLKRSTGTTGPLQTLARRGQTAPGGGTFTGLFSSPSVNAGGTVAFAANVTNPTGAAAGIFKGVPGALATVVVAGDSVPVCGGQFDTFGAPSLDRNGAIAFRAGLSGGDSPSGVFVVHSDGSILTIACAEVETSLYGGATVEFDDFEDAVRSGAGDVAFIASVAGDDHDIETYTAGLYTFDERTGQIQEIARVGYPVPDVPESTFYAFFSPPAISDAGVSFRAFITGIVYQAIFFKPPGSAVASVIRAGDPVPGSTGVRFKRFRPPSMNDAGDIAVHADNLAAPPRHEVVFVPRGGSPENVAVDSQAAPVPEFGVVFKSFQAPALNNHDAVIFRATLSGSRRSGNGIFLCERR